MSLNLSFYYISNYYMMVENLEYNEAIKYLEDNDYKYQIINFKPLRIKEFKENMIDRCYFCKKEMMSLIKNKALEEKYEVILDGQNIDDLKQYRPGSKAIKELNILSPLAELSFSKTDIRTYSQILKIPAYNKPSNSCLATRFPYNTILTKEKLDAVAKAEAVIKSYNIKFCRARVHDDILRIEVNKEDFIKLNKEELINKLKLLGYNFITSDLEGYISSKFDKLLN